jgi:hypothetical protein
VLLMCDPNSRSRFNTTAWVGAWLINSVIAGSRFLARSIPSLDPQDLHAVAS